MCNKVHKGRGHEFRKREKGTAYKLIAKGSHFRAYFSRDVFVDKNKKMIPKRGPRCQNPIDWYKFAQEDGFCFFSSAADIVEMLWGRDISFLNVEIWLVEFWNGVGSFYSKECDGNERRFVVAKSFRFLRELSLDELKSRARKETSGLRLLKKRSQRLAFQLKIL